MSIALNQIPPEQIDFGTRHRVDYGDVSALAETFKAYSIIQPLAIVHKGKSKGLAELGGELDPEKPFLLLAGGRRLKAILEAKEQGAKNLDIIPVRIYTDGLEADQIREIELFENIYRKDLSWDERNANVEEVHRLRVKRLGGNKVIDKSASKKSHEKPTARGTAQVLNVSETEVKRELQLAKDLRRFPEVKAKAKNRNEALKLIAKKKEEILQNELARRIETKRAKQSSSEIKSQLINAYQLGDCFKLLKEVKSGTVGFVNLDPPWANVKMAQKKSRPNLASFDNWTGEEYLEKIPKLLKECWRIMYDGSWGVFWFSINPWYQPTMDMLEEQGFVCNGIPALWSKGHGHGENLQFNLPNTVEFFLYFRKGAAPIRREGHPQEFRYTPVRSNRIHICEKPVELMEDILTTFCLPKTLVVDPFAGSGATLLAAYNVGMNGVGFDLAEESRSKYVVKVEGNEGDRKFH